MICLFWDGLEKEMAPTPVLLPEKSHGWRSLVGYSPWGRKELDTTERLHFTSLHFAEPRRFPLEAIWLSCSMNSLWKIGRWEKGSRRGKREILNANFDVNLWIVFNDVQAFKCSHWLLKFSTYITFLAFLVSFCLSYTQTTIYGLQGHHFCCFFFFLDFLPPEACL